MIEHVPAHDLLPGMFSLGGTVEEVMPWHGWVMVLWETGTVSAYESERILNVATP